MKEAVAKVFRELFDRLQKIHISSDMWHTMQDGITCVTTQTFTEGYHDRTEDIIDCAFEQQTNIRWGNVLKGRVALAWGHTMQYDYDTMHKDKPF